MALIVTSQTLEVDGLSATVVTAIVPDPDTGGYAREFRFFGPADTPGGTGPLILTVRARASDDEPLKYQAGPLNL